MINKVNRQKIIKYRRTSSVARDTPLFYTLTLLRVLPKYRRCCVLGPLPPSSHNIQTPV